MADTAESVQVLLPAVMDVSPEERADVFARLGEAPWRERQLADALRNPAVRSWDEVSSFPFALRSELARRYAFLAVEPSHVRVDDGGRTISVVGTLADGRTIETVVMHYGKSQHPRTTVCVSSQVGCAVGCPFCATGRLGLMRHCTPGEVLDQVRLADILAKEHGMHPVTHVVFMGMGEPLANLETTVSAVKRLIHERGMSARHITISTSGVIPGIERLIEEKIPVTIALSLHAATNELRTRLVPLNAKYPLDAVCSKVEEYYLTTGRRATYEWCLIEGINDTEEQASALAKRAQHHHAHINVIPMNRIEGSPWNGPSPAGVARFVALLKQAHVTVRNTRGQATDGACGQLRATHEARRFQLPDGTLTRPVRTTSSPKG